MVFGLFAPLFTTLMLATPGAFIATLAGLAMLRVLQAAFVAAFSSRFTLGALITFVVTVADVKILNVGAAFWGLVAGFFVSWLLERSDFGGAQIELVVGVGARPIPTAALTASIACLTATSAQLPSAISVFGA